MVRKEWNIGQSMISQWIKISENKDRLTTNVAVECFPPSMVTLYLLTTLDDLQLDTIEISPSLTQKDVKKLKDGISEKEAPSSAGRADGAKTKAEPEPEADTHHEEPTAQASDEPDPFNDEAFADKIEEERRKREEAECEARRQKERADKAEAFQPHGTLLSEVITALGCEELVWKYLQSITHPDKDGQFSSVENAQFVNNAKDERAAA